MNSILIGAAILYGLMALSICADIYSVKLMRDFKKRFPGRCFICSLNRYLVSHGHNPKPPDLHDCIENPNPKDEK